MDNRYGNPWPPAKPTLTFDEILNEAFTEIDRAYERGDPHPVSAHIGNLTVRRNALDELGLVLDADVIGDVIDYLEC